MINGANKISKIAEAVDVLPGYPFRGRIEDDPDGGVRVVQMKDVDPENGITWDSTVRTKLKGRRKPDWLKQGDVLFLMRGNYNFAVCLENVLVKAVSSPHFFLLRVNSIQRLMPEFLAWQINQIPAQNYIEASAEGTGQRSIRKGVLEKLPIVIPDLATQGTVVRAIGCIDRQLEIYREQIVNCKQQIRAVADRVLTEKRRGI